MTHRTIGLRGARAFALALLCSFGVLGGVAASTARADVGVVVTGEATMQPQLAAQLEMWLRAHGHELVSAPLPPEAINTLIDCFVIEDQGCASKVVEKRSKSSAVVFAQVSVTSGATALDRTVTLTAYWLDKGKEATSERRYCERCTDASLRDTADELMATLAGAGAGANRGHIKLTSDPPGARVVLAGKVLGATPLEYSLPVGEHQLVIELEGYGSETRRVAVQKGQIEAIQVTLSRPASAGPWRKPALGMLAGGGGLLLLGGILIAIDQDYELTGPQQPTYRDTATGGTVAALIGAAVLGAGAYLYLRPPGRNTTTTTTTPSSAPAVSFIPGGGVIGWSGRF